MRPLRHPASRSALLLSLFLLSAPVAVLADAMAFDFAHIAALRRVKDVAITADGGAIAYVVSVPRRPGIDEDGPDWAELHVAIGDGPGRAFVHGAVNVSSPRFSADGRHVFYLAARNGDEDKALWAIPVGGGESRCVLAHDTSISDYRLAADDRRLAFLATEAEDEARTARQAMGFTEEVLGEDALPERLWVVDLPSLEPMIPAPGAREDEDDAATGPHPLPIDGSVADLALASDGASLVLAVQPGPGVDDGYMFQRLRRVDAATGETIATFDNPGKLGSFALSPDGAHLAMISAQDFNDPREGRLLVVPAAGGSLRDLLPALEGHVTYLAWRDAETLVYLADRNMETELGTVSLDGRHNVLTTSGSDNIPVMTGLAAGGGVLALIGERPSHPEEAFRWAAGTAAPQQLSDINPWLSKMTLAAQEVVSWQARDGLQLEGVLIRPLASANGEEDGPAPLLMVVHGGPEGHVRNGWNTSYGRPGQLAAAQGYAVFYPNYRGSTGRGVAFTKMGQGDATGPEFDDLIDGVDHLVAAGIADRDRVGITGGSYGGFATAWCATRFSERFRAGVMFNGISNKHTKSLTTDIPEEDRAVHTLYDPWTRADFSLARSPLTYVEQSRTPLLIVHGTADTRVHPSQSLQLYNALRLLDNAPVRLVRYPGEPHGNRRAASRDDYVRRLIRWMNHFVLDGGKEAPPWELTR